MHFPCYRRILLHTSMHLVRLVVALIQMKQLVQPLGVQVRAPLLILAKQPLARPSRLSICVFSLFRLSWLSALEVEEVEEGQDGEKVNSGIEEHGV